MVQNFFFFDHGNLLQVAIEQAICNKEAKRKTDFVGAMLWQQQLRATEYFSKWIELKETIRDQQRP